MTAFPSAGAEPGATLHYSRAADVTDPPLLVYRGEYGAARGVDPFDNTKRCTPSFTRSREVARVYAKHPNGAYDDVEDARLGSYYLDINNPLDLSTRDPDGNLVDSVATVEHLRAALVGRNGINEDEVFRVLEEVDGWRWFDTAAGEADWVEGSVRDVADEAYVEPHHLGDSPKFVALAERAGYDGLCYNGHFSSEHLLERPVHEVVAEGGYDDRMFTSEEWRPFRRHQVRLIEVTTAGWPQRPPLRRR